MKRTLHLAADTVALVALLAAGVFLAPAQTIFAASSATSSPSLQFVPTIKLAPESDLTTAAGPYACTSPAPVVHSKSFHCYTPADIYAAYGVDSLHAAGITGKGETIIIADSYGSPTAQQDLNTFSDTFGLPRTTLTIINPTGTPAYNNSVNGSQPGWAFETSLDIEWAHAIAPDAHIVLVEGNPAETEGVQGFPSLFKGEEMAIQRYPGAVLSQSFAVTEESFHAAGPTQVALYEKVYQEAVANHVTVLGSSGDSGTANGDKQGRIYPYPTVNWPSSDPLVTSAGGTWLQSGWRWNPANPDDLSYTTTPGQSVEAVWNEPYIEAATGGGLSHLFPTPSFQSNISSSILQGARGLPDLSWNAAVNGGVLVYVSFGGVRAGWHIVGGTSASSPQLAALIALTNQVADSQGKAHVGYLNPYLYQMPASAFNDTVSQTFGSVTIGDNSEYGSGIDGYPVMSGYDLATGFGSPRANVFVPDLVKLLP